MAIDISSFSKYLYDKIGIVIDSKNERYILDFINDNPQFTYNEYSNTASFQSLINKLTINETYFFRDESNIDFIRDYVLKRIKKKSYQEKLQINIWSVGCSSGEEPYTIALSLKEAGIYEHENINLNIYGFDLNTDFLKIANNASYSSWSFRGMPEKYKKYFEPDANGYYLLKNEIKEKVKFAHFNIKEDIFSNELYCKYGIPDIIICRNTLMYFDRFDVKNIISRMTELITENGCIISGAHELNIFKSDNLILNLINGTFVFTKLKQEETNKIKKSNIEILEESRHFSKTVLPKITTTKIEPKSNKPVVPSYPSNKKLTINFSKTESKLMITKTSMNKIIKEKSDEPLSEDFDLKLEEIMVLVTYENYQEALNLCNKLIAYKKDDYIPYYIKSFIYFILEDTENSINSIENSILLNSMSALLHYSYSNILINKSFDNKVIYHLKKAKSLIQFEDERILNITKIKKDELEKCIDMTLSNLEVTNE